MYAAKILVVDDDDSVCRTLARVIRSWLGYPVAIAYSAEVALDLLSREEFDVMLLDLLMPGMDGHQLAGKCRQRWPAMAIIIITGDTSRDAVLRSVCVADAFLCKPVQPEELSDALHRAMKMRREFFFAAKQRFERDLHDSPLSDAPGTSRHSSIGLHAMISVGSMHLDLVRRTIEVGGNAPISLTGTECAILFHLLDAANTGLRYEDLASKVKGQSVICADVAAEFLRPHIKSLRKKIEQNPKSPIFLQTDRLCGYRLRI